jgi:hypothetical protein
MSYHNHDEEIIKKLQQQTAMDKKAKSWQSLHDLVKAENERKGQKLFRIQNIAFSEDLNVFEKLQEIQKIFIKSKE